MGSNITGEKELLSSNATAFNGNSIVSNNFINIHNKNNGIVYN